MTGPIYKFYRVRPTEAYYQLDPTARQALLAKIESIGQETGAKSILQCSSSWSNECWMVFGVEEFADLEAVKRHQDALEAVDWFRYIESETMLGLRINEQSG